MWWVLVETDVPQWSSWDEICLSGPSVWEIHPRPWLNRSVLARITQNPGSYECRTVCWPWVEWIASHDRLSPNATQSVRQRRGLAGVPEIRIFTLKTDQARSGAPHFHAQNGSSSPISQILPRWPNQLNFIISWTVGRTNFVDNSF